MTKTIKRLGQGTLDLLLQIDSLPDKKLHLRDFTNHLGTTRGFTVVQSHSRLSGLDKQKLLVRERGGYITIGTRGVEALKKYSSGILTVMQDDAGRRDKAPINQPPKPPAKNKKKELKDIIPIPFEREENISPEAEAVANSIAAMLEQNQMYRDYLKNVLHTIAEMLGAQVVYTKEEKKP